MPWRSASMQIPPSNSSIRGTSWQANPGRKLPASASIRVFCFFGKTHVRRNTLVACIGHCRSVVASWELDLASRGMHESLDASRDSIALTFRIHCNHHYARVRSLNLHKGMSSTDSVTLRVNL
ncbi:hypothetical protein BAUCODRAFT_433291 [Baudoinia panamericana UAMH 10762]|uniref:Uncharacterized protein n=1 Tax=Baudoinia panamericana (strain UAMH 10762) TaxID=717646 RepID=M2LR68_BAUPA|nr:uncharacterized protein BAUCODRAFT_433291 [Baudoinia panamericana UAMH 10762]EMC96932.1 hypothetical protein BAUCODRAFT_433291 [Baudoinia panamericana UAMH 10762]